MTVSGRVLILHCSSAAAYPPILNAAAMIGAADLQVTVLSSPSRVVAVLVAPEKRNVRHVATPIRPSAAIRPVDFAIFWLFALYLALVLRPRTIYASDPLASGPALWAARLCGAEVIYHEHDTPRAGRLAPIVARWRRALAHRACLVVTPNASRGEAVRAELGLAAAKMRTVWNTPMRAELQVLPVRTRRPLLIYYHGSITPDRLPRTVATAVRRFGDRLQLRIGGYEAPNANGYSNELVAAGQSCAGPGVISFAGVVPTHDDLLAVAAQADVGLALMPMRSDDINMRHMTGASNKAFDYMAAGLPLIVSNLPEWREMFVEPGYGLACDPEDPDSIVAVLTWFLDHEAERQAMGARGRAKIEADWNYDTAFAPILATLFGNDSISRPAPATDFQR